MRVTCYSVPGSPHFTFWEYKTTTFFICSWIFFHSDRILTRFQLGKLLLMLKINLLWKIWLYKKGETCVQTPPPLKRCYGRRLWCGFWPVLHQFWPLFSRKWGWKCINTIYACLFKVIIEEIKPQNCHADTSTKVSESLSFGRNHYYFRREKH